ncbi:MAG: alkaline phosphatase family protein [Geminicoccaceae bacterium]
MGISPMQGHVSAVVLGGMLGLSCLSPVSAEPPKLILQITVDQLRGDLLTRYLDRMGEGGLRYLLDEGVVYLDAHHTHANTETIVGHVTLATGAQPAVHGMIGNAWFDRKKGRLVYNVEDDDFPILSADAGVDKEGEIDPTQKAAGTDGRSPRAILTSTFSDEMAIAYGEEAKIFGVSVKDRGAISMAGHAGKAFWFSKSGGEFITSSYYYDQYPDWVAAWNAEQLPLAYADQTWDLLHDRASYRNGDRDDLDYETDLPGFGRVFPHAYGPADGKLFTTLLTLSPAGDALTVDFAKALVDAEEIGQDNVPDYLSVSLSCTDYVGHVFGPSSLEMEDQLLRLDLALADLLAFIDARIGLDETLIVLSADHGAAEPPGYLNELGIPARTIDPASWNKEPGLARLRERFGLGEELIAEYFHPYIYLDREAIAASGFDQEEVERAVAEEVMLLPGIDFAISSSALAKGDFPETPIIGSILNNANPHRSGDVFVVFEPHAFINDFDGLSVASHHGSPWSYDSFVPMIVAGHGLEPTTVARKIETVDLAPTLSAYLGIKPPSGADGNLLSEVLAAKRP